MLKLSNSNITELPGKFPEPVEKEARSAVFRDEVFRDREKVKGFTIDDIDSPDLDDAIWLEQTEEGWRVEVSISDVDSLVHRDSYIDVEAMSRVHTHYFPQKINGEKVLPKFSIPMLPKVLSENRLSLRQGVKRPTLTVEIRLSDKLGLLGVKIKKTYLQSLRRLGLREYRATKVIGDPGLPLWDYYQLARALNSKRWAEGQSIAFQELKEGIYTDEDGMVQEGSISVSNLIVQEFMILANHAVGRILEENRRVAPFRNHLPAREKPPTREQIIAEIERTSDYLSLVENLRSTYSKFLSSAIYEHRATGHFGIGLPVYIHFTSPIRRYADLVAHRVVKALIDGERPPYSRREMIDLCQHLNQRSRRLATLRSIGAGTNSLHNYRNFGHLLHKEKNGQPDFVARLLDFLKRHRIGNAFFEFTANNGYNIELSCFASVRFQRVRHQARVTARADKRTVKNEAARLLYRKIRELVAQAETEELEQAQTQTRTQAQPQTQTRHSLRGKVPKGKPMESGAGPVAQVYKYCEQHGFEIPTFHYECWNGGPGPISCFCQISDALTVTGFGESRELSRREAATKMLKYLTSGQHISLSSVRPPAPLQVQDDGDDEPDQEDPQLQESSPRLD